MREVMLGHIWKERLGLALTWDHFVIVSWQVMRSTLFPTHFELGSFVLLNLITHYFLLSLNNGYLWKSILLLCSEFKNWSGTQQYWYACDLHLFISILGCLVICTHRPTNPASLLSHELPLSCSLEWHQVHTVPILLSILWPAVM